ncbi:MAG: hypothetical protein ABI167_10400 [Nitrosospira sp.]
MSRPPILPQGLPPDIAQEALNRFQNNNPPDLAGLQNLARLAAAQQHMKDQNKTNLVQITDFLAIIMLLLRLAPLLLFCFMLLLIFF